MTGFYSKYLNRNVKTTTSDEATIYSQWDDVVHRPIIAMQDICRIELECEMYRLSCNNHPCDKQGTYECTDKDCTCSTEEECREYTDNC